MINCWNKVDCGHFSTECTEFLAYDTMIWEWLSKYHMLWHLDIKRLFYSFDCQDHVDSIRNVQLMISCQFMPFKSYSPDTNLVIKFHDRIIAKGYWLLLFRRILYYSNGTARRRGGGLVEGVGAPLSSITMIQLLHCWIWHKESIQSTNHNTPLP